MHGVGADHPIELPWYRGLSPYTSRSQGMIESVCRIFGGEQASNGPVRVGEGGLYRIKAVEQDAIGLSSTPSTPWISSLSTGMMESARWLGFGARHYPYMVQLAPASNTFRGVPRGLELTAPHALTINALWRTLPADGGVFWLG